MSEQSNNDAFLAQSLSQQQNNWSNNQYANKFENRYIALGSAQWKVSDDKKQLLEETNNILLPESALNELIANNCNFPIILEITNTMFPKSNTIKTFVGVQEFSSIDGIAVIPNHMMQKLQFPTYINVKYINLPKATSITFEAHQTDKISLKYIREKLCKLTCLSIHDTIQVVIDDKWYDLKVKKIIPSTYDAVSLQDVVYSVDINMVKPFEDEGDNDECPIISSISSTKGKSVDDIDINNNNNNNINDDVMDNNNDTMGDPDDVDNNEDNAAFDADSDDADGWGDDVDEEFSDYDYDGQDYIPVTGKEFTPSPNKQEIDDEEEEELVPDPNSTHDGNNRILRPVTGNANHRAWICEFCHAINNLLDSLQRNYKCNCCDGRYRPGQTLIESKKQDQPEPKRQAYKVWVCQCERLNMIDWTKCACCYTKKPVEGLITFISPDKPPDHPPIDNVFDNNNNNNGAVADAADSGNGLNVNCTVWTCSKCSVYNSGSNMYCIGCNKYRWEHYEQNVIEFKDDINKKMKKNMNVYRREYNGYVASMGNAQNKSNYPVLNKDNKINMRLVKMFGTLYRNSLIVSENEMDIKKNIWRTHNEIGNGIISVINDGMEILKPLNARCIAINERNGYIVQLSKWYMVVLEPKGANEFAIKAVVELNTKESIKTDVALCRVRFVGDNIYVFHHDTARIYHYWFDEAHKKISFVSIIYDKYFSEAIITDILVTDKLLIILFDRWLGIYKLYPSLEWYHAVAFSRSDNISVSSLEMSYYDDWDDRLSMEEENYFKAIGGNKEQQQQPQIDDDDDMKREEEEKQDIEDEVFMKTMPYKACIKNYIFLNCENSIIAIHPTNPTFDFLHIAKNVKQESSFCISKKYGTFYVNNECDRIIQSGRYDQNYVDIVCEVGSDDFEWKDFKMIPLIDGNKTIPNKHILKFNGVYYDEGYGISGRLLANCMVLYDNENTMAMYYQLFNWNELIELKRELERTEYFWMPGIKTFNLIVFVFEMLYGTDLIDLLLESSDFNSVYALPGMEEKEENEQKKEEKEEDEEEKEENKNDDIINELNKNKLIKIGSNVLIYVNKRWCDGIVLRMVDKGDNDKNDYLEIGYCSISNNNIINNDIDKCLILNRYDKYLKYNEQIPLTETSYIWQIGNKCLYKSDEMEQCWCPGQIINIFTNNDGKWLKIKYNSENGEEARLKTIKYDDKILKEQLVKLNDVVPIKQNDGDGSAKEIKIDENDDDNDDDDDDDNDNNMDLEKGGIAEGVLGESYVAVIKAIGNEQAENDEDLIEIEEHDGIFINDGHDIDMEIEQEGVNEMENN